MVCSILLTLTWSGGTVCKCRNSSGQYDCTGVGVSRVYLRFIILERDLLRLPSESLQRASCELLHALHKRLRRVRDGYPVPIDGGPDVWAYRPYGKSLYGTGI